MEDLVGTNPGHRSGLTFAQHLNQWITFRNALAHHSVPQLIERAAKPDTWTNPKIGDPASPTSMGDPDCGSTRSSRTIQPTASSATPARAPTPAVSGGCLALIIQAVDRLIVKIAQAHGRIGTLRTSDYPTRGFSETCLRHSAAPVQEIMRTGPSGAERSYTARQTRSSSKPHAPAFAWSECDFAPSNKAAGFSREPETGDELDPILASARHVRIPGLQELIRCRWRRGTSTAAITKQAWCLRDYRWPPR